MNVDEPGRHPAVAAVDDQRAGGRGESRTHGADLGVDDEDVGVVEPRAGAGEDGGVLDEDRRAGRDVVGRGVGWRRRRGGLGGLGGGGLRGALARLGGTGRKQGGR